METVFIVKNNERTEVPVSDPRIQAYNALQEAAKRIGDNNYDKGLYRVRRNRRGAVIQGYQITDAHKDLIEAMPKVLDGDITPDEAMNLIWRGDVQDQRGL